jgi:hypothetical protein
MQTIFSALVAAGSSVEKARIRIAAMEPFHGYSELIATLGT